MDYLAHALWSFIIFHKAKKVKWAVLFGLLPDSLSWVVYLFYRLFTFDFKFVPPEEFILPKWMDVLYGISHSLVVFAVVALIVYIIFKKIPIYMYAWPIAIIFDTLTHTREMFPTPFLWPFNIYFSGITWGNFWFMLINYCAILGCLIWILVKKKKSKK